MARPRQSAAPPLGTFLEDDMDFDAAVQSNEDPSDAEEEVVDDNADEDEDEVQEGEEGEEVEQEEEEDDEEPTTSKKKAASKSTTGAARRPGRPRMRRGAPGAAVMTQEEVVAWQARQVVSIGLDELYSLSCRLTHPSARSQTPKPHSYAQLSQTKTHSPWAGPTLTRA